MTDTDTTAPAGTSTVITFTEETLAAELKKHRDALLTKSGAPDLRTATIEGLNFELPLRAVGHFDELQGLGYLAGLPSLPCCSHHDEDVIEAWIAGVEKICNTGELPD